MKRIFAPNDAGPSFSGSVQITGIFTESEAAALADVLNSGALDFQITVGETTYIVA